MSLKSKVIAAAAALTIASGLGVIATGAASAATPSCGNACIDIFSHQFGTHKTPAYVVDVLKQGEKAGQPVILFRTANFDPAEDWTLADQGTTADFFAAGMVSAAVALHYGCIPAGHPGHNFPDCYGQTTIAVNDPAYEIEYAPFGVDSGLCMGLASTAVQGEGVTLQGCGTSAGTVWIADIFDSPSTLFNGYIPAINGTDTNFSQPFVLTYPSNSVPTDSPRPQLEVRNITGFSAGTPPGPELGTVDDNQLWGADFGVLK